MSRVSRALVEFFDCFYKDPDPKEYPVNDRRWKWRPISQSPFACRKFKDEQTPDTGAASVEGPKIEDDTPKWVHLFYDLAWTATFATLTQYGQFNRRLDTISYVGFFVLAWWLWAAQAVYTIHFYTNDWFHYLSLIVQLGIFGMLAATTRGYDIANYIVYSPGTPDRLEPRPRETSDITDPKIYSAEAMAATSLKVTAISVAISRIVLLVQYIRVIVYARVVAPRGTNRAILQKISMVPVCMVASTSLFVGAWVISTSATGRTPYGAKLKFVFWGVALAFEAVSHVVVATLDWRRPPVHEDSAQDSSGECEVDQSDLNPSTGLPNGMNEYVLPIPYANVTLSERLEGVTTIILGEGINGITGSLYTVISVPGSQGSVTPNAISAAIIVCCISYFYFEGPRGPQHPKGLRQMTWLFLHLPFLLGIILLLLGVKDQFLLMSFTSAVSASLKLGPLFASQGLNALNPSSGNNTVVKDYFLERGVIWSEQWENILKILGPIEGGMLNQSQMFDTIVWHRRLSLRLCVNAFEVLMGETREIPHDLKSIIDSYYSNQTYSVVDQHALSNHKPAGTMTYYKILDGLVNTKVQGTRYIIGLAGGVLICLSLLNLTHFKPRDRFQWGIILSRFVMGWCLVCLLLLNLGHYQTLWIYPDQEEHQAGVFRWFTTSWILPTIATALGIQLVIETAMTGLARLRMNEVARRATAAEVVEEAKRNGREITGGMYAEAYVRPQLQQLVRRKCAKASALFGATSYRCWVGSV